VDEHAEPEPALLAFMGRRMVLPSNGKTNSFPTYGGSDSDTEPNNMQVGTLRYSESDQSAEMSVNR
jgi:hypothetical protein